MSVRNEIYICQFCGLKMCSYPQRVYTMGNTYYFCSYKHANIWLDNRNRFYEIGQQPQKDIDLIKAPPLVLGPDPGR